MLRLFIEQLGLVGGLAFVPTYADSGHIWRTTDSGMVGLV
jgi:hypothetical protein